MSDAPTTPTEARQRLGSLGLDPAAADVLFAHFDDAERRGKRGHGYSRIAWLEEQQFDRQAVPGKDVSQPGLDRWDGGEALGYLTLQAICDDLVAAPPATAKLVVAARCFPTGALGYWVRQVAERAGLIALLTATSPRRLAHPDGSDPLTGTNPLAIAIPSSDGQAIVVDVSMGAVTHGDVLATRHKLGNINYNWHKLGGARYALRKILRNHGSIHTHLCSHSGGGEFTATGIRITR